MRLWVHACPATRNRTRDRRCARSHDEVVQSIATLALQLIFGALPTITRMPCVMDKQHPQHPAAHMRKPTSAGGRGAERPDALGHVLDTTTDANVYLRAVVLRAAPKERFAAPELVTAPAEVESPT